MSRRTVAIDVSSVGYLTPPGQSVFLSITVIVDIPSIATAGCSLESHRCLLTPDARSSARTRSGFITASPDASEEKSNGVPPLWR